MITCYNIFILAIPPSQRVRRIASINSGSEGDGWRATSRLQDIHSTGLGVEKMRWEGPTWREIAKWVDIPNAASSKDCQNLYRLLIVCTESMRSHSHLKVILQQEESLRFLKVWVMAWSVPDRFIMSMLRGRCGMVNYHPVLNLIN